MKNLSIFCILFFFMMACGERDNNSSNAAFVTMLGNDTLAVEEFEEQGNEITAWVALRSPQTTLSKYDLTLDESGGIEAMTRTDFSPDEGFEGEGTVVQSIQKKGDSLRVEIQTEDGSRSYSVIYQPGVLPFIDMVHWPYELALNHANASEQDTVSQMLLTGNRLSNFVIASFDEDSMSIRHPSRGVMGVTVANNGDIQLLDAGLTTRKLKVHRKSSVNFDEIAADFAAAEQRGNAMGELSGAETAEFSFNGADFAVEYGSPQKRGRKLFGGIVPWGERWRTGANRATHFSTSEDLMMGDLEVPAGEYTLFTIPESDGGTLIINKQTGQNGRSYDQSRDLGRVPMQISGKETVTEAFTVRVEETDTGGVLRLIWGETVFSVNFAIN